MARRLFTVSALLAMAFGAWIGPGCNRTAPRKPLAATSNPAANAEDVRMSAQVLGTWYDEYQGRRTMTLNADGTGTMLVELSGLKAMMFASKLRFDMVWSIENGRLKKQTIGGEPSGRVKLILSTMGDSVDEPILKLTEQQLLLLDKDGETKYDWRRVRQKL